MELHSDIVIVAKHMTRYFIVSPDCELMLELHIFNQVACSYALLIGLKFFGRERDMLAGKMNWTSVIS